MNLLLMKQAVLNASFLKYICLGANVPSCKCGSKDVLEIL